MGCCLGEIQVTKGPALCLGSLDDLRLYVRMRWSTRVNNSALLCCRVHQGTSSTVPSHSRSCATAFSTLLVLQGPALLGHSPQHSQADLNAPCTHLWYLCPFLCLLQARTGALTLSPLDSGTPTSKLPRFYICFCLGPPLFSDWLPAPSPADLLLPVGTTVII